MKKIFLKKKLKPIEQKTEKKTIVHDRENRNMVIPFKFRKMFFNTGSLSK